MFEKTNPAEGVLSSEEFDRLAPKKQRFLEALVLHMKKSQDSGAIKASLNFSRPDLKGLSILEFVNRRRMDEQSSVKITQIFSLPTDWSWNDR